MGGIEALGIPGFREPVASMTHLIGAVVFAMLTIPLVRRGRGNRARVIGLAILGFSSVLLLSLSGVYHLLSEGTARNVMKRLDIAGVFILIAGTFTPAHVILFRGWPRWGVLALVWTIVVTGITLRMVFFNSLPGGFGVGLFLLFGWGGAAMAVVLWRRHGLAYILDLVLGGVAYTIGAIVLSMHWPVLIPGVIGPHEVWHVAVLIGLALHWRFIYRIAGERPVDIELNQPSESVESEACSVG